MYHTDLKLVSSYIVMNNRIYFRYYIPPSSISVLLSNVLVYCLIALLSTVELVITSIAWYYAIGIASNRLSKLKYKLFAILIPSRLLWHYSL
jgi:hypothetical protein